MLFIRSVLIKFKVIYLSTYRYTQDNPADSKL